MLVADAAPNCFVKFILFAIYDGFIYVKHDQREVLLVRLRL
jgi:hypothetical protein